MSAAARAVFLDRDGTINVEKKYLSDPNLLELFPGVPAALSRLQSAGFVLFVVTNQSGIGRGYYTETDMHAVNRRLEQILAQDGIKLQKFYFAPESPEQPSYGRKPSPRFLFDARDEFGLDLGASYMIGDKLIDLECGWNAGVRRSILVRTGYGKTVEAENRELAKRAWVVEDLKAAAEQILSDSNER